MTGADSLIHVGNNVASNHFRGGADSDLLRLTGTALSSVIFDGASGTDALLLSATIGQLTFTSGSESDVAILRGALQTASVALGEGNDRFVLNALTTSAIADGGIGDDKYEFAGSPSGLYSIVEQYYGTRDTSSDLIDFSSVNGSAVFNIAIITPQVQPNGIKITLSDGMAIRETTTLAVPSSTIPKAGELRLSRHD